MPVPTLVLLRVSPWSERVRWVFDHHALPYKRIDHAPVIGERRLRKLVGPHRGPATVPVLLDGDAVVMDSWAIARHADGLGTNTRLLPDDRLADIRRWNDLADRTMSRARAIVAANMLAIPESLDESTPPGVPALVRRLIRPINRLGIRWFARKYAADITDLEPHVQALRDGLTALRTGLAGAPHLLGELSYADIVMSNLLQGVLPVTHPAMKLGPATRRVWTHAALADEFADLVRWRDELYRQHRPPPAPRPA